MILWVDDDGNDYYDRHPDRTRTVVDESIPYPLLYDCNERPLFVMKQKVGFRVRVQVESMD